MDAFKEGSVKYGFSVQAELVTKFNAIKNQCRSTTFLIHQVRHLSKVLNASPDKKSAVQSTSNNSMSGYNVAYSDLGNEYSCPTIG